MMDEIARIVNTLGLSMEEVEDALATGDFDNWCTRR